MTCNASVSAALSSFNESKSARMPMQTVPPRVLWDVLLQLTETKKTMTIADGTMA
jgi:hypothetical protein